MNYWHHFLNLRQKSQAINKYLVGLLFIVAGLAGLSCSNTSSTTAETKDSVPDKLLLSTPPDSLVTTGNLPPQSTDSKMLAALIAHTHGAGLLARQAAQKAKTAAVRGLAEKLAAGNLALAKDLETLAAKKNWLYNSDPSADEANNATALEKDMSGDDEKHWVASIEHLFGNSIKTIEENTGPDSDLKLALAKALRQLREWHGNIEAVQKTNDK